MEVDVSSPIMWKPANPCQTGADWQMAAVGDAVCFPLRKWLEGTNEQGSVNDRNSGILRLWRGQAFCQWIKHFMAGNHSFFLKTLHYLKACRTWRQTWKMPQTEVWAFVLVYAFIVQLFMRILPHCMAKSISSQSSAYEEEMHSFLALHGVGGGWNYFKNLKANHLNL